MKRLVAVQDEDAMSRMEKIQAYTVPPWCSYLPVTADIDRESAVEAAAGIEGIIVATSASEKAGTVGAGGTLRDTSRLGEDDRLATYSMTIGSREEQNPYMAELAAMAMALRCLPGWLRNREVIIISSNRSALQVVAKPRQQSGQYIVQEIYRYAVMLQSRGNAVKMMWVPAGNSNLRGLIEAKIEARKATETGRRPASQPCLSRATTLRLMMAQVPREKSIPKGIGRFSKRVDRALPGPHTRSLYDGLKRKEADVLAQLRTGKARLNSYLQRIGAAESKVCDCGQATETIEHFLFRCIRWKAQREILFKVSRSKIGNLSFFVGGKAASDGEKWAPDMKAVRAAIKFAMETKRFEME
ncbi:hypothetical protein E5D57_001694 [Metarhizium anisopliae]|nr:hypothetical protein E5D57_001694 [Metarhizium anisopliae]